MKVILLQHVKKIGKQYEVVEVSAGLANNRLFPQKLALPATPANQKELAKRIVQVVNAESAEKSAIQNDFARIKSVEPIELSTAANEQGHLYAKIGRDALAKRFTELVGHTFDPGYVHLEEPIANTGKYVIVLRADSIKESVNVTIVAA